MIETPLGDYKLSPAYDLLNNRIHIEDKDFALDDGLLPASETKGKIKEQFYRLGELADIQEKQIVQTIKRVTSNEDKVLTLINASYLNEKTKRNYTQVYQTRLKKLLRA